MARPSPPDEIATVVSLCRDIGLGHVSPTLLKAAHHTSLLIAPQSIVARVQSAEPIDPASERASKEMAVTRHLADHGAPTLAPIAELAGPRITAPSVVTFWPYLERHRTADDDDTALATTSLASVHQALRDYRGKLPSYMLALDRCWAALADDRVSIALSLGDRNLLKAEYRRLRHSAETTGANWTSLHGDAHLSNLLLSDDGPVWLDFEDACIGPREYDIANLPADAWPYFTDADPALCAAYAHLRSVCVAVWCSIDGSRSAEILEAADYHLANVRQLAG